jgi:hypothetical protein
MRFIEVLKNELKILSTHVIRIASPMFLKHPSMFELIRLRFTLNKDFKPIYQKAESLEIFTKNNQDYSTQKTFFSKSIEIQKEIINERVSKIQALIRGKQNEGNPLKKDDLINSFTIESEYFSILIDENVSSARKYPYLDYESCFI